MEMEAREGALLRAVSCVSVGGTGEKRSPVVP